MEAAGDVKGSPNSSDKLLEQRGQIPVGGVHGSEAMGEIMGMVNDLLDQFLDSAGLPGFRQALVPQRTFHGFEQHRNAHEFLAQIIVEIEPDPSALIFGDREQ